MSQLFALGCQSIGASALASARNCELKKKRKKWRKRLKSKVLGLKIYAKLFLLLNVILVHIKETCVMLTTF